MPKVERHTKTTTLTLDDFMEDSVSLSGFAGQNHVLVVLTGGMTFPPCAHGAVAL
jgi:hypothetical protein